MISTNGKHTFATLAEALGVTVKTIQRDLDNLKQLGLLIREDGTRGKWIVVTNKR
jgi:DeoR/GlpR family transcriptional regulator of sugar metabolism